MTKRSFRISTVISSTIITAMLLQTASCGYVLHPERRNQNLGSNPQLDMAVVGLDAIGLIFFLIPGIIAYAVDFNTNTIYMPSSHKKFSSIQDLDWSNSKVIKVSSNSLTPEGVNAIVAQNSNTKIDFKNPSLQTFKDQGLESKLLAALNP